MRCYATITDFLRENFNIYLPLPIQTFGFFVLLAVISVVYVARYFLMSMEKVGYLKPISIKIKEGVGFKDVIFAILIWFFIGWKVVYIILNWRFFSANPQNVLLSGDGYVLLGLIFGGISGYLKFKEIKKNPIKIVSKDIFPSSYIWNIVVWALVGGFIGAKIFHLMEYPQEIKELFKDPKSLFAGLTFWGGLIGGAAVVIFRLKQLSIPILIFGDSVAPALILGYGIGRLGCHFAGDGDWGIISLPFKKPSFVPQFLWGYTYPHNVLGEGVPIPNCDETYCTELPHPVFPTPLYESILSLLIFGILSGLFIIRKWLKHGSILSFYLILAGIERFFIEFIRVNPVIKIFGYYLSQAQIISLILIGCGVVLLFISMIFNARYKLN